MATNFCWFDIVVVLSADRAKVEAAAVAVEELTKLRPSVAAMNWNALMSLRNMRRDLSAPLSLELTIPLLPLSSGNRGKKRVARIQNRPGFDDRNHLREW